MHLAALQSLARTGLGRARHGLGVLGPFGNRSTLDPDEYQVTGNGVYLWNGNQSNAGSITQLNMGDRVTASGTVTLDVGNGKYYAKVQSDKAPNAPEAWIAVEYLAPLDWKAPAQPPPAPAPPSNTPPAAMTGEPSAAWKPWLVGGLALLGTGGLLYLLLGKKKGKGHGGKRRKARR
jgi:hypothetical protein